MLGAEGSSEPGGGEDLLAAVVERRDDEVIGVLWRNRPHPAQRRPWLSQELVGAWLSISQEKLSRIESGKEPVWDLRDLAHHARVLRLPQPQLSLGPFDGLLPLDTRTSVEPIDRRLLLGKAAAIGLAALPSARPPKAVIAAPVDPERVSQSLELQRLLADQDNAFGARAVVVTVRRELAATSRERQAARGTLRTALLRVEARWAEFAGWLSDDSGDAQAGDYWLDRAMTLTQEAGDRLMASYILMRQSQRASERGDGERTLALAQAAQHPRELTGSVRALGAIREAQGHALAGDAVAAQRKLDEAHRVIDHGGGTLADERFDALGAHYTTHAYIAVHEAQCWDWLGRPGNAATTLDRTLASWPGVLHRDAGLHRARLAHAYAMAGEPDRSAAEALTALEIARSTRSARIDHELDRVYRRLSSDSAPPARPRVLRCLYRGKDGVMASDIELQAMRRAIALAARGLGTASPNPVVGCVVLDGNGRTVGEGWHERPGEPHAEVNALRATGGRANGATAVVTLEPCNHYGRPFVTWTHSAQPGKPPTIPDYRQLIATPETRTPRHRLHAQSDAIVISADCTHTQAIPVRETANGPRPLRIAFEAGADPHTLLEALPRQGVLSVLIEDDPTLASAFLTAGLIDRINPEP